MASKNSMKAHLILVTKYRKKCLTKEIMEFIIEIFKKELTNIYCYDLIVKGDSENHIHLHFGYKPNKNMAFIVSRLKCVSCYQAWKKFPNELRKHFWHGKNILWSKWYFCNTTGNASAETIKKYIENQG